MRSPPYIVDQLTVSSCLPEEDFRVTVCIGDMSKITCSGDLSEDGLTVTWSHPFLLWVSLLQLLCFLIFPPSSAPPNTPVQIAIWFLPEELTHEWDKQPLSDHMITDIASLLKSGNTWKCKSHICLFNSIGNNLPGNVHGFSAGPATLFVTCRASGVLVSSML